ncbi:hypothetical protein HDU96_008222 [Phlyctochytrium bullatum]|nr:hypothetical protein HDU96_008222 [Phlyctochytrium bullatum]
MASAAGSGSPLSAKLSPLVTVLSASALLAVFLPTPVSAETQAYYQGCKGDWEFNSNFRTPSLRPMFTASPKDFSVVDCAMRCGKVDDYVFLAPPTIGDKSQVTCNCVSKSDPVWSQDRQSVPGIPDDKCRVALCKDNQACGGGDKFGTHYAVFLIANPNPRQADPPISPAARAGAAQVVDAAPAPAAPAAPAVKPASFSSPAPAAPAAPSPRIQQQVVQQQSQPVAQAEPQPQPAPAPAPQPQQQPQPEPQPEPQPQPQPQPQAQPQAQPQQQPQQEPPPPQVQPAPSPPQQEQPPPAAAPAPSPSPSPEARPQPSQQQGAQQAPPQLPSPASRSANLAANSLSEASSTTSTTSAAAGTTQTSSTTAGVPATTTASATTTHRAPKNPAAGLAPLSTVANAAAVVDLSSTSSDGAPAAGAALPTGDGSGSAQGGGGRPGNAPDPSATLAAGGGGGGGGSSPQTPGNEADATASAGTAANNRGPEALIDPGENSGFNAGKVIGLGVGIGALVLAVVAVIITLVVKSCRRGRYDSWKEEAGGGGGKSMSERYFAITSIERPKMVDGVKEWFAGVGAAMFGRGGAGAYRNMDDEDLAITGRRGAVKSESFRHSRVARAMASTAATTSPQHDQPLHAVGGGSMKDRWRRFVPRFEGRTSARGMAGSGSAGYGGGVLGSRRNWGGNFRWAKNAFGKRGGGGGGGGRQYHEIGEDVQSPTLGSEGYTIGRVGSPRPAGDPAVSTSGRRSPASPQNEQQQHGDATEESLPRDRSQSPSNESVSAITAALTTKCLITQAIVKHRMKQEAAAAAAAAAAAEAEAPLDIHIEVTTLGWASGGLKRDSSASIESVGGGGGGVVKRESSASVASSLAMSVDVDVKRESAASIESAVIESTVESVGVEDFRRGSAATIESSLASSIVTVEEEEMRYLAVEPLRDWEGNSRPMKRI